LGGCSAPVDREASRERSTPERSTPEYDPFLSSRTDTFVSSTDVLTTVKSPPTRIVVRELSIDMQIEPHALDSEQQMSLPEDPFLAGWYEFGAAPNSPAGATVLAAHVDSPRQGIGPFAALRSVQPGVEVVLVDASGISHGYRVIGVEKIDKGVVPWRQYFSMAGEPRLILITCGGRFNESTGSYTDNYIVTAEKVS
jgi:hypothetical protein